MDKVKKGQFPAYIQEARSWETSSVLAMKKLVRMSLAVGAAGVVVGTLGVGSATLQATKEPPMPLILWGDKSLGRVDQIQSLAEGKITAVEATDKYFAQLYVQYRETWSPDLAKEYHYRTALMSTDAEQQRYEAFMQRSDKSPRKLYGDNARVRTELRGTSFVAPGVASVRYIRLIERPGTATPETSYHTATVTFAYSSGRMAERDRAINPLGFQTSNYRTDPDVPEATPVVAASAPNPPATAPALAPALPVAMPLDLRPLQVRGQ
jgi:type IV secretion system protein VirB8